eukprot:CAMPEP_0177656268 /NCGR_PEP_ID=MMETSP0447-20121125/15457_1 /TAXON_ID=0 /ORGANISM="Stygamoeba regulata, Strain BSH-02190019" /LENGTH=236 /DNA_ID=CAMNT_0019160337 /DNA_START=70 /DNA_END=783 /DNA_ORIENTATION=-
MAHPSFLSCRVLLLALLALACVPAVQASCGQASSCAACTAAGCSWCELDSSCHALASPLNKCHYYEGIRDAKLCGCAAGCTPKPGLDKTACAWYDQTTGSANPDQWAGGDFLPVNYRSAAVCACSGCGVGGCNRLWEMNPPAASCVRTALLAGHQALNATFRQFVRDTPYADSHKYVQEFYDMHVRAYAQCCCPGSVAPLISWQAIFYAGAALPCNTWPVGEIASILSFGRCGCGW